MDTNYGSISVLFFTEDSCTGTHTLVPFGVRVDQYTAVITNDMFVFLCFLQRHWKTSEDFKIKRTI